MVYQRQEIKSQKIFLIFIDKSKEVKYLKNKYVSQTANTYMYKKGKERCGNLVIPTNTNNFSSD